MSNKVKNKIEKLLNLSMSDNQHEAGMALQRALKLMNEHNITEDEVYRQNFISKSVEFKGIYRVPQWLVKLHGKMANIAGCIFTWKNGMNSRFEVCVLEARGSITGRERDVENAIYLIAFLKTEIENKTAIYKKQLHDKGIKGKLLANHLKSFKEGIIHSVFVKLYEQQNKFFNQQQQERGLVCVDMENKIKESMDFLDGKFKVHKSKAKQDKSGLNAGILAGKDIAINQAINRQDETLQIERKAN